MSMCTALVHRARAGVQLGRHRSVARFTLSCWRPQRCLLLQPCTVNRWGAGRADIIVPYSRYWLVSGFNLLADMSSATGQL
jgi:hypothetical protein